MVLVTRFETEVAEEHYSITGMLYMAERLGRSGRGLLTYGGSTAIAIIPSHPRQLPRPTEGPLSSYRVTLSSLFRYVSAIFHLRADHNEKGRTLRSTMCTSRRHGISMAAGGTESPGPDDSTERPAYTGDVGIHSMYHVR